MKQFGQSHIYGEKKNDYASSSITVVEFFQNTYVYIMETPLPTTTLREAIGLFSSRNLQVTTSRFSRWLHTRAYAYIVSVKW